MSDSSQENPQELLTPWNITVEEAGRFKKKIQESGILVVLLIEMGSLG